MSERSQSITPSEYPPSSPASARSSAWEAMAPNLALPTDIGMTGGLRKAFNSHVAGPGASVSARVWNTEQGGGSHD